MSGLSVTDIIARNRPLPNSPHLYGPGFLFYLKNYLLEETEQKLSQVCLHLQSNSNIKSKENLIFNLMFYFVFKID